MRVRGSHVELSNCNLAFASGPTLSYNPGLGLFTCTYTFTDPCVRCSVVFNQLYNETLDSVESSDQWTCLDVEAIFNHDPAHDGDMFHVIVQIRDGDDVVILEANSNSVEQES